MILYFVVLGFVGGYLLTNLFLDGLINKINLLVAKKTAPPANRGNAL
jgi:hypothetical protein